MNEYIPYRTLGSVLEEGIRHTTNSHFSHVMNTHTGNVPEKEYGLDIDYDVPTPSLHNGFFNADSYITDTSQRIAYTDQRLGVPLAVRE